MSMLLKMIITGLLFLLTIISGIWLSNSRKPLNKIIFNIHKLLALVMMIFLIILFHNLYRNFGINFILFILIIFTGLLVVLIIITGGLLSFDKPVNKVILSIHTIIPIITVIMTGVIIFFILNK